MILQPTLIAFDGNWLLHRAYHGAEQAPEEARPRMVARQLVSWAFKYAIQHRATHLLFAFDGDDLFRKKKYPLYKSSRTKVVDENGRVIPKEQAIALIENGVKLQRAPDPIYECQVLAMEVLREYHVPIIHKAEHEADDIVIAASTIPLKHPVIVRTVMVAKDKDVIQGVHEKCYQWYPDIDTTTPGITIRHSDLSARLVSYVHADAANWTPTQFRDYQVLIGDPTDDVPPILSHAKARKILNEHGTLLQFFKTKEGSKFYYANQEFLQRNRMLVVMRKDCLDDVPISFFEYNTKKTVYSKLGSNSKSVSQAHADYVGWRSMAGRKTLF